MKNMVKIQARAYSVELRDIRTDEIVTDSVILTREQLKAADDTGLTLAGLMTALYDRKGYRVVKIGTPVKKDITLRLTAKDDMIAINSVSYSLSNGRPVIFDLASVDWTGGYHDGNFIFRNRDRMTGKELAALAAVYGGDDLRHYCEYLKAHGYCGDAFKDASKLQTEKEREQWAVDTYNRFIFRGNDDDGYKLRAYMFNPDKPLSGSPEDKA